MIIILMGLCFILSVSCVSAYDSNETCNFTELNELINDEEDINLTKDYAHVDGDDDVVISKSVQINGNNHTIDNDESPIYIDANDSSVIFENVNFLNQEFEFSNNTNLNVTFINCRFNSTDCNSSSTLYIDQFDEFYTTSEVSPAVAELARAIVGNSQDYEAAIKLANWVGRHVKHETAAGFYQSPDETLMRKRGNCCCQADLFLQMCVAVGLNEKHSLYLVHVGTYKFGSRHFFAMVDNILVDPDSRPDSPWGQASVASRDFFRITEYPFLPIARDY